MQSQRSDGQHRQPMSKEQKHQWSKQQKKEFWQDVRQKSGKFALSLLAKGTIQPVMALPQELPPAEPLDDDEIYRRRRNNILTGSAGLLLFGMAVGQGTTYFMGHVTHNLTPQERVAAERVASKTVFDGNDPYPINKFSNQYSVQPAPVDMPNIKDGTRIVGALTALPKKLEYFHPTTSVSANVGFECIPVTSAYNTVSTTYDNEGDIFTHNAPATAKYADPAHTIIDVMSPDMPTLVFKTVTGQDTSSWLVPSNQETVDLLKLMSCPTSGEPPISDEVYGNEYWYGPRLNSQGPSTALFEDPAYLYQRAA